MACSSNSQSQSQAQSHLDCPVCLSTLKNPRQFPCGHIFCGPPEICYRALENERGCKCPMCPKVVSVRELNSLPPMYQFNHFLEESAKAGMKRAPQVKHCKKHGLGIKFKCVPCRVPMCDNCLVENHNGHRCEIMEKPKDLDKKFSSTKETFDSFDSLRKQSRNIIEKLDSSLMETDEIVKKSRSMCAHLKAHLKKFRDIDAAFAKHEADSKAALQNVFDLGEMPQGSLYEAMNFIKTQHRRCTRKSPEIEMKENVEALVKMSTEITDMLLNFGEKFDRAEASSSKTKKQSIELVSDSDSSESDSSIECLGDFNGGDPDSVTVVVHSVTLEEQCKALKNSKMGYLFVCYKFLDVPLHLTETPISLEKPQKADETVVFNFQKTFVVSEGGGKSSREALKDMFVNKQSGGSKIRFDVVAEPKADDGECEDVGYAEVDILDLVTRSENMLEQDVDLSDPDTQALHIGSIKISIRALAALKSVYGEMKEKKSRTGNL